MNFVEGMEGGWGGHLGPLPWPQLLCPRVLCGRHCPSPRPLAALPWGTQADPLPQLGREKPRNTSASCEPHGHPSQDTLPLSASSLKLDCPRTVVRIS